MAPESSLSAARIFASNQIAEHVRDLEQADAQVGAQPSTQPQAAPKTDDHPWAKRLGPLGPLAIFLAKAKFFLSALLKLKFLFSFVAFLVFTGRCGDRSSALASPF